MPRAKSESNQPLANLDERKLNPSVLFTEGGTKEIIAEIEAAVDGVVFDMEDETSRKECKALAKRVASSKVLLDNLGKEYVAELKKAGRAVDAERRSMRNQLDALRDKIKAPVDAYEQEVAQRMMRAAELFNSLNHLCDDVTHIDVLREEYKRISAIEITDEFADFMQRAFERKNSSLFEIQRLIDQAVALEESLQKAAELRAEQQRIEREEREREIAERAAAEAKAKAERERMRAEAEKREAEEQRKRAEQERIAALELAQQAEKLAKEREERLAKEAAEAQRAAAERREREVKQAREDAERKARIEAEEAQRKKKAEEEARRQDNLNRTRVRSAILTYITDTYPSITEEDATNLIDDIDLGLIPQLSINW